MLTKEMQALHDVSSTGRERPWREKKEASTYLAFAYQEVNQRKADRVCECGTLLVFKAGEGELMRLHSMNSCRVRLCPMCAWRRSLKTAANVARVMDGLKTERTYAYLFLTLTVRNCAAGELSNTMDALNAGWQRFSQTKAYRAAVKGTYKAMEITHNTNRLDTAYDTYHPHFHVLIAVNQSYFNDNTYLSKEKWIAMWRKAMRLDYDPSVYVKRVKGDTAKAVAEVAKYAVKDGDYIIPHDWDLTVDAVRTLDEALTDRRLITYAGKMKEWHRKLNLDDDEDGDLINVGDEDEAKPTSDTLITYAWNSGFNQYYRVNG
jgi:plasmid rolling circle replication initiator protein Rep